MLSKPCRTDPDDLDARVKAAIEAFERLPPEEKRAHRRAQAISFVYGNLAIENERVTREMVANAYDAR